MGKITILPDILCNQIAAGEVVERPAAVVKELMENSIDAGGRKISVSLLQGGRKEVRVVDNGSGMSSDDALMALERHATSKIRTLEDLQSVQSLGFRGEALSSISAVSRFELVSREADALCGTSIRIEAGILRDVRETGCAAGTAITVRDLFYNVPARRKFLRSVDTEMANIADQFMRLAMAHPDIHFQLSHQERMTYDFPKAQDHLQRVVQILGVGLMGAFSSFALESPPHELHGFVGSPEVQRSNSRSLFVYVNGRAIWDRMLNQSILRAYDTLLPKGKFPLVILFLKIPPALVDVNVHPTKREVKFRSPGEIMDLVQNIVRKTLQESRTARGSYGAGSLIDRSSAALLKSTGGIRETQINLGEGFEQSFPGHTVSPPHQISFPTGSVAGWNTEELSRLPAEGCSNNDELLYSNLPILGQLANTYILLEAPDGLVMIDQHAAHERILYDQLSASKPGEAGRQRLTRSVILELLPKEAAMLRRWTEKLAEIGFEIEPFGQLSFTIQAVPAALSGYSPDTLLREVLENAQEEQQSPNWDFLAGLTKTASCHAAIRAGQRLQREEIVHLLETLDRKVLSATCPHGRPLACKLTHGEIARLFSRT